MIVISDTSPIINLAMIGRLEILPAIFGRIVIPSSVYNEIVTQGRDLPGSEAIRNAPWVDVLDCNNKILVNSLLSQVDQGEAEAIVLAMEIEADLILIDERIGRNVAKNHQLTILGLLGIIKIAKQRGLITEIKPVMHELVEIAGFRISPELFFEILKSEGEL